MDDCSTTVEAISKLENSIQILLGSIQAGKLPEDEHSTLHDLLSDTASDFEYWKADMEDKLTAEHESKPWFRLVSWYLSQALDSTIALRGALHTQESQRLSDSELSPSTFVDASSGITELKSAMRKYDVAMNLLTTLPNPPCDTSEFDLPESMAEVEVENDVETTSLLQDQQDITGTEFDPDEDFLISEESSANVVTFKDLSNDAFPIESASEAPSSASSDTSSSDKPLQIPPWQDQLLLVCDSAASRMRRRLRIFPVENIGWRSGRDDFLSNLNTLIPFHDAGALKSLNNLWDSLQLMSVALARIQISIVDTKVLPSESLLWVAYSGLLLIAGKQTKIPQGFLDFVETLVASFPKVHKYAQICGPHEKYDLTNCIVNFYRGILNAALEAVDQIAASGKVVAMPSHLVASESDDTLLISLLELENDRRELDKLSMKELLIRSGRLDQNRNNDTNMSFTRKGALPFTSDPYHNLDIIEHEVINDAPIRLLTKHFKGRLNELEQIVDDLYTDHGFRTNRCVIYGAPTIGKTQVALKYTASVFAASPVINVFWITGSSTEKLHRSFEHILALLKGKARKSRSHHQRMLAVREHLNFLGHVEKRSWLVVVDDLREGILKGLKEFLPSQDPKGRIIFTTSSKNTLHELMEDEDSPLKIIRVETMPAEDAAEALISAANLEMTQENFAWAIKVANSLGGFPIAVKHVGAILKRCNELDRKDILKMCETKWATLLKPGKPDDADRLALITPVFHWILEHLRNEQREVFTLLRVLALLDPDSIPFGPLVSEDFLDEDEIVSGNDVSKSSFEMPDSPENFDTPDPTEPASRDGLEPMTASVALDRVGDALEVDVEFSPSLRAVYIELSKPSTRMRLTKRLLASSLVGKRSNDSRLTLRIHEAVQNVIVQEIQDEGRLKEYFDFAVTLLNHALVQIDQPFESPSAWRRCALLAPHFESLFNMDVTNKFNDVHLARSYLAFGEYLNLKGQYEKAIACFTWCRDILPDPESREAAENLGRVLMKSDKSSDAEKIFSGLLGFSLRDPIVVTENQIPIAEGLALSYYLQGKLLKAKKLYIAIYRVLEAQKEADELMFAKVREGLGNTFQRIGDPKAAEEHYRKCVEFWKQEPGHHRLSLLRFHYNQARLLRDLNQLSEAEEIYKSILEEYDQLVGKGHPDALLAAGRLAYTYAMQGKYAKAKALARGTLGLQQSLGDSEVAMCYTHWVLADIYTHENSPRQAEGHFLLALDGYVKNLKNDHPLTLYLRRDFSHMLQLQGRLEDAVRLLEEVREHIEGTAAAAKLARLYDWQAAKMADTSSKEYMDRIYQAEQLARNTLTLQKERFGSLHVDTNYTLWVLARICRRLGNEKDAHRNYKHALEGYQRISGEVFDSPSALKKEYAEFCENEALGSNPRRPMRSDASFCPPESPFRVCDVGIDEFYPQSGQSYLMVAKGSAKVDNLVVLGFERLRSNAEGIYKKFAALPASP